MNQTDQLDDRIDLGRVLTVLRRHRLIIALCALVVAGATFAFFATREKEYSATAGLLFRDPGFDQRLFGSDFVSRSPDADRDAATNLGLVSQREVSDTTAKALGPGWTGREVRDRIEAEAVSRSDLINIVATDTDPKVAAKVANAFAQTFVRLRRTADQDQIRGAQEVVAQQLASVPESQRDQALGTSLERREQELRILASLQTGKVEVVQPAPVPDDPSGPRIKRNMAVGLVFGLILGIALAVLRDRLDRRVRDPEEVEAILERPILGMVPDLGSAKVQPTGQRASLAVDSFQSLRTNLRFFNPSNEAQTILVTSSRPGDGKSFVSLNLAFAAAEAGLRTIVIGADLRRPTLGNTLGLPGEAGLSTVLVHQTTLAEAVQEVPLERTTKAASDGGVTALSVLLSGPLPPNPADLLESAEMGDLLTECERDYDLVIVDTAPVLIAPDAVALFKRHVGVLIVARMGRTERDSLSQLNKYLRLLNAPVLGVVANAIKMDSHGYGYGYGYGYGDTPAATLEAPPRASTSAR